MLRIGHGYDVHAFAEDRKCVIGGVEIPCEKGLLGHSDADVLLHAVSDSLLGAAALGDIGKHFPDTDPKFRGANSLELLSCVVELLAGNCYNAQWNTNVLDNIRLCRLHVALQEGKNRLTVGAVDAGVIVQKLVIYPASIPIKPSYLGPCGE